MRAKYKYNGPIDKHRSLIISDEIALWIGRFLVGEGSSGSWLLDSALFWSSINRYFLHSYFVDSQLSFIDCLRINSMCLQPYSWMARGTYYTQDQKMDKSLCRLSYSDLKSDIKWHLQLAQEGRLLPDILFTDTRISRWTLSSHYASLQKDVIKIEDFYFFSEADFLLPGTVVVDFWSGS